MRHQPVLEKDGRQRGSWPRSRSSPASSSGSATAPRWAWLATRTCTAASTVATSRSRSSVRTIRPSQSDEAPGAAAARVEGHGKAITGVAHERGGGVHDPRPSARPTRCGSARVPGLQVARHDAPARCPDCGHRHFDQEVRWHEGESLRRYARSWPSHGGTRRSAPLRAAYPVACAGTTPSSAAGAERASNRSRRASTAVAAPRDPVPDLRPARRLIAGTGP